MRAASATVHARGDEARDAKVVSARLQDAVDDRELTDINGQMNLLLEEYRSLRDEAKQRITERMTLVTVLVAGTALVISGHGSVGAIVIAAVLAVIAACVWLRTWRILDKLSIRLMGVESRINRLAAQAYGLGAGAELLSWETTLQRGRADMKAPGNRWWVRRWAKLVHPHAALPQVAASGPSESGPADSASSTDER